MTQDATKDGSTADWLADKALRALIGSVMKLPYEKRVQMMGTTLRRAVGPLVGYRKRAEDNLALIYPEMADEKRRQIAEAVCDNFGRTLIENYSYQEFGERLRHTQAKGEGLDNIAKAKADGQAVIFVTGHFGNHEAPRHVLTQAGYDIGGLYRKMGNPYFNEHYSKTMTSWGGPVFEQGRRGTMGFARHLKSGGMGTLLFDVNASGGIPISFMGRTAMTAPSAAELAIRLNALVVPYFGTRQGDGLSLDITVEAPVPVTTVEQTMGEITQRLEDRVKATPEQWFWVHRRWKSQPKGTN